jgi:hypothetical protein
MRRMRAADRLDPLKAGRLTKPSGNRVSAVGRNGITGRVHGWLKWPAAVGPSAGTCLRSIAAIVVLLLAVPQASGKIRQQLMSNACRIVVLPSAVCRRCAASFLPVRRACGRFSTALSRQSGLVPLRFRTVGLTARGHLAVMIWPVSSTLMAVVLCTVGPDCTNARPLRPARRVDAGPPACVGAVGIIEGKLLDEARRVWHDLHVGVKA